MQDIKLYACVAPLRSTHAHRRQRLGASSQLAALALACCQFSYGVEPCSASHGYSTAGCAVEIFHMTRGGMAAPGHMWFRVPVQSAAVSSCRTQRLAYTSESACTRLLRCSL